MRSVLEWYLAALERAIQQHSIYRLFSRDHRRGHVGLTSSQLLILDQRAEAFHVCVHNWLVATLELWNNMGTKLRQLLQDGLDSVNNQVLSLSEFVVDLNTLQGLVYVSS